MNKNALLQRLNFNAQDVGMIRLRSEEAGKKLQEVCTSLWVELSAATYISEELASRLHDFHNQVEKEAKQTGLYV